MITNKIISILIVLTSVVVIPVQIVSTFVLGLLVTISFGLLLLPISLIWSVLFLGPLLGLSYVFERVVIIRPFISAIGIPLAVLGNAYISIMPSMGEWKSRFEKMVICQTFPYTYRYFQIQSRKLDMGKNDVLVGIFREVSKNKPLNKYLNNLRADVVSRPSAIKSNYELDW